MLRNPTGKPEASCLEKKTSFSRQSVKAHEVQKRKNRDRKRERRGRWRTERDNTDETNIQKLLRESNGRG